MKKRGFLLIILFILLITTLLFPLPKINAAEKQEYEYDWGYMWWLSNSFVRYNMVNKEYQNSWSKPPKYPQNRYGHWAEVLPL